MQCLFIDGKTKTFLITPHLVTISVNPDTVGQYTGLKDKGGREIYEGDVLRLDCWKGLYYIVFVNGSFFLKGSNSLFIEIGRLNSPVEKQARVIGNIFDNKELIKPL